MGEYDVDYGSFIGGLLPQSLRGTVRVWTEVLCQPFKSLHHRFYLPARDRRATAEIEARLPFLV